ENALMPSCIASAETAAPVPPLFAAVSMLLPAHRADRKAFPILSACRRCSRHRADHIPCALPRVALAPASAHTATEVCSRYHRVDADPPSVPTLSAHPARDLVCDRAGPADTNTRPNRT